MLSLIYKINIYAINLQVHTPWSIYLIIVSNLSKVTYLHYIIYYGFNFCTYIIIIKKSPSSPVLHIFCCTVKQLANNNKILYSTKYNCNWTFNFQLTFQFNCSVISSRVSIFSTALFLTSSIVSSLLNKVTTAHNQDHNNYYANIVSSLVRFCCDPLNFAKFYAFSSST